MLFRGMKTCEISGMCNTLQIVSCNKNKERLACVIAVFVFLFLFSCSPDEKVDADWSVYSVDVERLVISKHHVVRFGSMGSWVVNPELRSKDIFMCDVFRKREHIFRVQYDVKSEYDRLMLFWGDRERVEKELLRDDVDHPPFVGPTELFICESACGAHAFLVEREKSYLFGLDWGRIMIYPIESRGEDYYVSGPAVTTNAPFPYEEVCDDFMELTLKWIEFERKDGH